MNDRAMARSRSSICAAKSRLRASSPPPSRPMARARTKSADARRGAAFDRRWSPRCARIWRRGGQSMVFLNRRGYHNFLQCHICGNVIACPNCSVSMTFHLRDRSLRCHYCGNRTAAPEQCPECNGSASAGRASAPSGCNRALAELMPTARIERMDSDTSGRKGARARYPGGVARRRNRHAGRHPDDHQGLRFSRRDAGRGGDRRCVAQPARFPLGRANVPVADPGGGTRGTRRTRRAA